MDEVKPQDLSLSFLREFMNLPNSYFDPGAPIKYREYKGFFHNSSVKSLVHRHNELYLLSFIRV